MDIIPYLPHEFINNLLQLEKNAVLGWEKPGYSLVIQLCIVVHDNCIFTEFLTLQTFKDCPETPEEAAKGGIGVSDDSFLRGRDSLQIERQETIQFFLIVIGIDTAH